MHYVYNPTVAPQSYGSLTLAPKNYSVVDDQTAKNIIAAGIPVLVEGQPGFQPLFVTCAGRDRP